MKWLRLASVLACAAGGFLAWPEATAQETAPVAEAASPASPAAEPAPAETPPLEVKTEPAPPPELKIKTGTPAPATPPEPVVTSEEPLPPEMAGVHVPEPAPVAPAAPVAPPAPVAVAAPVVEAVAAPAPSKGFETLQAASMMGEKLWADASLGSNGKSCSSQGCHAKYQNLHFEQNQNFPHVIGSLKRVMTLTQIINRCVTGAMGGKALDADSDEMTALASFHRSQRITYFQRHGRP